MENEAPTVESLKLRGYDLFVEAAQLQARLALIQQELQQVIATIQERTTAV